MKPTTIDIPAVFRAVTGRVNEFFIKREISPFEVFYEYGRYFEVTRNLVSKDKGITTRDKKYPLIWIVVPYDVVEVWEGNETKIEGMEIVIAARTEQNLTTLERYDLNFYPSLYPIYDELRNQIVKSGYFIDIDMDQFLRRRDQPYWDGKDGQTNAANMFNDRVDAIQLKGISLKLNEQTCTQFRLVGPEPRAN